MQYYALLVGIALASMMPPIDNLNFNDHQNPHGQGFGTFAKSSTNLPMLASRDASLDLQNEIEANFEHANTEPALGVKLKMKTSYPTYNLNNNAHVTLQ